jgi:hypothetical protein
MRAWIGSAARKATHHCLPQLLDDTLMECNMLTPICVKPVPDFDDLTISTDGQVWRNGRLKKQCIANSGYWIIGYSTFNKTKSITVHTLLLKTFVGPRPEAHEALHINGNRLDNRLENLRWGTRKENVADAIRHGTATIGTKNKQAKFDEQRLKECWHLKQIGMQAKEIAKHFNVCVTTIHRIFSNKTYRKEI